ncbi:MAG TPA: hypothetical protein VFI19_01705 [Nocardioides sp.]|nr:hypothetical protein [Nocardioides sp.]
MTSRSISPAETPSATPAAGNPPGRPKRPAVALAAAVLMLVQGTFTSVAGCVFSLAAGGGWYAGAAVFAVAVPAWWVAGVGLLRGRRRAYVLCLALLLAQVGFGLLKILHYHESAAYGFGAVTLLNLALVLAGPTRRWADR